MNNDEILKHLEEDATLILEYKHGIFDILRKYTTVSLSDIYTHFITRLSYDNLMVLYCEVTSAILDEKERSEYEMDKISECTINKYEELRKLIILEIQHKNSEKVTI